MAQRSGDAAKEIRGLIEDSVRQVTDSTRLIRQAGQDMRQVARGIHDVAGHVEAIAQSSSEQGHGLAQIGQAIHHIDQLTQNNAHMVRDAVHQAQSLELRARTLGESVQGFHLQQGKPQEAIELVDRVVQLRRSHTWGPQFWNFLTDPQQRLFYKDMYVFILDALGNYIVFGGNPAKVGTSVHQLPGVDGQGLLNAIVNQSEQGPGWVEYDFTNPVTGQVQAKMSYVRKLDDGYLGCGVYKNSTARAGPEHRLAYRLMPWAGAVPGLWPALGQWPRPWRFFHRASCWWRWQWGQRHSNAPGAGCSAGGPGRLAAGSRLASRWHGG